MAESAEKIMMEFEMYADKLFSYLYERFETDTQRLDRQQNENVFQQSAARYTQALKEQLSTGALQIIEANKHAIADISHIQHILTNSINKYVNEFNQRAKQL